ncbi:MAG: hypothetical protein ACP5N7_01980 [Candidatus Pacearchaeota archaeon]
MARTNTGVGTQGPPGNMTIGDPVAGGTPTEVLYIDNSGNLYSDSLFTRDSSTKETYIAMEQNGGTVLAGVAVDNDLVGVPGTNGVAMRRADLAGTVGSNVIALFDGTPLGAPSEYLGVFRADDDVTGEFGQGVWFGGSVNLSAGDGTDSGLLQLTVDSAALGADNIDGLGSDEIFIEAQLDGGSGAQKLRGRYKDGTNNYSFELDSTGFLLDYDNFSGTPGTFYRFPLVDGSAGQTLATDGAGQLTWSSAGTGTITGSGTDKQVAFFTGSGAISSSSDFQWNTTSDKLTVASGGLNTLLINPTGKEYGIGDLDGLNENTRIYISDSNLSKIISLAANGDEERINVNGGNRTIDIGDVDNVTNHTRLIVDVANKDIFFHTDGFTTHSYDIPITVKTTLSSADILSLNSTPIVITPAVGTGKIMQVLEVSGRLRFNTTAYSVSNALVVLDAGSGSALFRDGTAIGSGILLPATSTTIGRFTPTSAGNTPAVAISENASLKIQAVTADPTLGDSEMDIYVTYKVVTL